MRSNPLTRQTGAVIVVLVALVIAVSLVLRRPIMGLRSVSSPPAVEVAQTLMQNDRALITVRNNDSNPIIGEAGYTLVNQQATPIYEATPIHFGPLAPAATEQLTFDLPANRADDTLIQAWAREQIAYLDPEVPIEAGLSLREQPDQGVKIERAAFASDDQGSRTLSVDFRLANVESGVKIYRYAVGLMWSDQAGTAPAAEINSQFSPFTVIDLAAGEVRMIHFEAPEIDLDPGTYRVSLWVQRQDESGTFAQLAQVIYGQELTAS